MPFGTARDRSELYIYIAHGAAAAVCDERAADACIFKGNVLHNAVAMEHPEHPVIGARADRKVELQPADREAFSVEYAAEPAFYAVDRVLPAAPYNALGRKRDKRCARIGDVVAENVESSQMYPFSPLADALHRVKVGRSLDDHRIQRRVQQIIGAVGADDQFPFAEMRRVFREFIGRKRKLLLRRIV